MEEHLFIFQHASVRTIVKETETWFVAKDICDILQIANHRDAVSDFEDYEKDDVALTDAIGRQQNTIIISEPGLYHLIFKSQKPEAKAFQQWVWTEILPAIRRQGYYATPKGAAMMKAAQRETARLLSKRLHATTQMDNIAANLKVILETIEKFRDDEKEEMTKIIEQGGANNLVLTGEPYAACIRVGGLDED